MESLIPTWQVTLLCGILIWIVVSSMFNVTRIIRSLTQPWVSSCVISGTPIILQIQKYQHSFLDALFAGLSCVVSVPFYTGFLPLLFWSGHGKLARQMTLLMAFCDYTGNCIKVSLALSIVLQREIRCILSASSICTCLLVCLSYWIGVVDIVSGLVLGLAILAFWLSIHDHVDNFVVSGQNVTSFWAALSLLMLFAYPTPEFPTPSFEYHTAFTGVALGIVTGVQQTYEHFHHEQVARVFTPRLLMAAFAGRILIGIPTILVVKFCSKALAKWILPITANALGISIRSSGYVPALSGSSTVKKSNGYLQKMFFFSNQDSLDVDTGIRLLQYAGLAWSVVDLVPSIFSKLNL
ncbi:hypothetical protein Ccrd_013237 [Cynara cardunculus var. scolymus]|uniref:Uncharacterized protein n=1 Tax=Cynara cardunculus var. scolymus TaxID=59895 RepID=A0A103YFY8_CYNCS|nr:hypothetical protein Ccrd_013237 [Cynara cardunculus var. scolymus]